MVGKSSSVCLALRVLLEQIGFWPSQHRDQDTSLMLTELEIPTEALPQEQIFEPALEGGLCYLPHP